MVLSSSCTVDLWQTDMGVIVCRLYKAMYSFLVIGLASEAANAILDYRVMGEQESTGTYQPMVNKSPAEN